MGERARQALDQVCDFPVRRPKTTLVALLLISCLSGLGILRIKFDAATERVFPKGHRAVATYQEFRAAFGGDEAIFILVDVPQTETDQSPLFTRETLIELRAIARDLKQVDGIEEVLSLSEIPVLRVVPFLGPTLTPGLPTDLTTLTDAQLKQFQTDVLKTPFVDRILVSTDRRATVLLARQTVIGAEVEDGQAIRLKLIRDVEQVVAKHQTAHPTWHLAAAGSPVIKVRIMDAIKSDLITFAAPLILIALFVSWLALRSVAGVLMMLGVLIVGLDLTIGTMGHLGIPLDPMTTLVPVLLLVIGVADSLHLLVEQRAQARILGPDADGATTIQQASKHVFVPCLLTSVTTAIGFATLVTSPIPPVARFGIAAALSAVTVFLVTFVLVPAVASLLPPPRAGTALALPNLAGGIARVVLARPKLSVLVTLGLTLALGAGYLRVIPNTDFLAFFPDRDPLVKASRTVEGRFAGLAPCELLVKGPPDCARDPKVLTALLALERELEQHRLVDMALSVADCVAVANSLVPGNRGRQFIPPTREGIEKLGDLIQRAAGRDLQMDQLISRPNAQHADEWIRVTVRARAEGSYAYADLIKHIKVLEAKHLTPVGASVEPTGATIVFSQTADTIAQGQITSFLWAFVTITIVLIIALRSVRLGLLSAIPNVVPVLCMLGVMGYLDIPLNSFNTMVASIAIGIAVDDTIHILMGFKRFSADGRPLRDAVQETISHEGTALLSTSVVLFAGFMTLLLAYFRPTADFGLLTGVAIGTALVGDLVMLPALLVLLPVGKSSVPTDAGDETVPVETECDEPQS